MKKRICLGIVIVAMAAANVAVAAGDVSCPASTRAERKPARELTQLLRTAGWAVRKLQLFNGCYEVYGFDEQGRETEAYFDPRTLQPVAPRS